MRLQKSVDGGQSYGILEKVIYTETGEMNENEEIQKKEQISAILMKSPQAVPKSNTVRDGDILAGESTDCYNGGVFLHKYIFSLNGNSVIYPENNYTVRTKAASYYKQPGKTGILLTLTHSLHLTIISRRAQKIKVSNWTAIALNTMPPPFGSGLIY